MNILRRMFDHEYKELKKFEKQAEEIMALDKEMSELTDTELQNKTEEFFGIRISEEKEIAMIIVPTNIKDEILKEIYDKVGLKTPGSGIAFTLPVEDYVGLNK